MKQKTRAKRSSGKGVWFMKIRGSYLPSSLQGWLTYIPYLGYLVFTFIGGIKETRSVVFAILFIVPNWVAALAVMTYLAGRHS